MTPWSNYRFATNQEPEWWSSYSPGVRLLFNVLTSSVSHIAFDDIWVDEDLPSTTPEMVWQRICESIGASIAFHEYQKAHNEYEEANFSFNEANRRYSMAMSNKNRRRKPLKPVKPEFPDIGTPKSITREAPWLSMLQDAGCQLELNIIKKYIKIGFYMSIDAYMKSFETDGIPVNPYVKFDLGKLWEFLEGGYHNYVSQLTTVIDAFNVIDIQLPKEYVPECLDVISMTVLMFAPRMNIWNTNLYTAFWDVVFKQASRDEINVNDMNQTMWFKNYMESEFPVTLQIPLEFTETWNINNITQTIEDDENYDEEFILFQQEEDNHAIQAEYTYDCLMYDQSQVA